MMIQISGSRSPQPRPGWTNVCRPRYRPCSPHAQQPYRLRDLLRGHPWAKLEVTLLNYWMMMMFFIEVCRDAVRKMICHHSPALLMSKRDLRHKFRSKRKLMTMDNLSFSSTSRRKRIQLNRMRLEAPRQELILLESTCSRLVLYNDTLEAPCI